MEALEVGFCSQEVNSTLLVGGGKLSFGSSKEIKEALEKGDVSARALALEALIRLHVNGESQNHMIMTVIKYITPLDDHLIKKLVLYFWEVVDKTDKDGNLLSVIILICSFLRNDLQHPNEYVRGLTLRFLCKLKEKDLIEPLVSTVVQNLTHRVTYVRRNAVLTVHSIYSKFPDLLPDGPDLMETFIRDENDVSARRNAFDMLAAFAPERAASYLGELRESGALLESGGVFLMSVVEFCRQMIRANPYDRARYVPILFSVLQSKSPAVRFQCASTLLSLSSSPTAIRQAALTYIDILKTHVDNSVRLIVVEQLDKMRERHLAVLQELMLDVLSALHDGTTELRLQIVYLAVGLVSQKNIEPFVHAMKKELVRAQSDVTDDNSAASQVYNQMVIKAINTAVVRFPSAAGSILSVMLDYVCDAGGTSTDVVLVIKEVLQMQPDLRRCTVEKLVELLPLINSATVMRSVLWIFGAHSNAVEQVFTVLRALKQAMQPLPLLPPETTSATVAEQDGTASAEMQAVTSVREDGTYVTTYTTVPGGDGADHTSAHDLVGMRAFIVRGDYFLASALASTLVKLVVQLYLVFADTTDAARRQAAQIDAVAILEGILHYGTEAGTPYPMDDDAQEHLRLSLSILSNPSGSFLIDMLRDSARSVSISERYGTAESHSAQQTAPALCLVDTPVVFTQLSCGKDAVFEMEAADDTTLAVGKEDRPFRRTEAFLKRLEETVPLSGFCDPVYCEASVTVHEFDVSVDWLLVNRTSDLLQNLTIELASLGGMKLCERPQAYILPPHASIKVKSSLKVSATETGVIYGSVLYDSSKGDRCCVILTDIHVDIMNYIRPASCSSIEFRDKWSAFDWENKINVQTDKTNLHEYIEYVRCELNMHLLEPLPELADEELHSIPLSDGDEDCEYLSCNLYARTVFGEDALANVSVERDGRGNISGVVRIRSNTQTIAYGIGEKLNLLQKPGKH